MLEVFWIFIHNIIQIVLIAISKLFCNVNWPGCLLANLFITYRMKSNTILLWFGKYSAIRSTVAMESAYLSHLSYMFI